MDPTTTADQQGQFSRESAIALIREFDSALLTEPRFLFWDLPMSNRYLRRTETAIRSVQADAAKIRLEDADNEALSPGFVVLRLNELFDSMRRMPRSTDRGKMSLFLTAIGKDPMLSDLGFVAAQRQLWKIGAVRPGDKLVQQGADALIQQALDLTVSSR